MPYFYWRGVLLDGSIKKGRLCARSSEHLDERLFKCGVALLSSRPVRWQWHRNNITRAQYITWCEQLASLLQAGVRIPDALNAIADQLSTPYFQEVMYHLADAVRKGSSLHNALARYPQLFNARMIQIIRIGEEAGNVGPAFVSLAEMINMMDTFYRRIRSALWLPAITFCFFVLIAGGIFTLVVPRFMEIFSSFNQELPPLTQRMFQISLFVRSWYFISVVIGLLLSGWLLYRYAQKGYGKYVYDHIILRIPVVRTIVRSRFIIVFLQSLALLLRAGMRTVPALQLLAETEHNTILKQRIAIIHALVAQGNSLSEACAQQQDLFSQEIIALINIGEQSGNLVSMLCNAGNAYQAQFERQLRFFTFVIQPLCMLLLGALITLLIVALYVPILNMAYIM